MREHGTEEGHAALSHRQQVPRMGDVPEGLVLGYEVEHGANQPDDDHSEDDPLRHLATDPTPGETAGRHPATDQEGHGVTRLVPANGQRPEVDCGLIRAVMTSCIRLARSHEGCSYERCESGCTAASHAPPARCWRRGSSWQGSRTAWRPSSTEPSSPGAVPHRNHREMT